MKSSTTDQVKGKLHEIKGDLKEKAGQVTDQIWRPKAKARNSQVKSKKGRTD